MGSSVWVIASDVSFGGAASVVGPVVAPVVSPVVGPVIKTNNMDEIKYFMQKIKIDLAFANSFKQRHQLEAQVHIL